MEEIDMKKRIIVVSLVAALVFAMSATSVFASQTPNVYRFFKSGQTSVNGTELKVTTDYKGPCTISYQEIRSSTITASVSASIAPGTIVPIALTVSGSYGLTLTSNATGTWKVPKKKTGYITFTPKLHKLTGEYQCCNISAPKYVIWTKNITAKFPKKLPNGQADGLYQLRFV
jgi:hypothetical protein